MNFNFARSNSYNQGFTSIQNLQFKGIYKSEKKVHKKRT